MARRTYRRRSSRQPEMDASTLFCCFIALVWAVVCVAGVILA